MALQFQAGGPGNRDPMAGILPHVPSTICKLLHELLSREVTSCKLASYVHPLRETKIVAAYTDGNGSVIALCVFDLPFAAFAGAALLMLPVSTARECIAAKRCTPELLENVGEIVNICRQCFQLPGRHVAEARVYAVPQEMPGPLAALVAAPHQRLDLEISISGYGSGRLTILV